jgi:hypothetical protein
MYEKFATFLRLEICVNRLKDLGLNKGLENLNALRKKLVAVTDRLASFEADLLNVHVDFPLFQRLAKAPGQPKVETAENAIAPGVPKVPRSWRD